MEACATRHLGIPSLASHARTLHSVSHLLPLSIPFFIPFSSFIRQTHSTMTSYASSVSHLQHKIPSGFTARSSADDVIKGIDLSGKNVIVTGGYSGIGLETTRVIAESGATVFVPARDTNKASSLLKDIEGNIILETLDLASPNSIDSFVSNFLSKKIPLHILINNAGISSTTYTLDARGVESNFAVNHLGPFQLTLGLLPALRAAKGARVVNVGSLAHYGSPIQFDDLHSKNRPYDFLSSYGQSKTANSLFALELDKRESSNGIRAFSLHPGIIVTNIMKGDETIFRKIGAIDSEGNAVIDPEKGYKTAAQGASTTVFAAVSPLLNDKGGLYLENNDVANLADLAQAGPNGVNIHALDDQTAKRLWEVSEELLKN